MVRGKREEEIVEKKGTRGRRGGVVEKENSHFTGYCPSWYDRHQRAQTPGLPRGGGDETHGECRKEKCGLGQATETPKSDSCICENKHKQGQTGRRRSGWTLTTSTTPQPHHTVIQRSPLLWKWLIWLCICCSDYWAAAPPASKCVNFNLSFD